VGALVVEVMSGTEGRGVASKLVIGGKSSVDVDSDDALLELDMVATILRHAET
jgi:hypothetical protein